MNWFRFGNPELLLFLWGGLPFLIILLIYGLRKKRKALLLFQNKDNTSHFKRYIVQVVLLTLSFLFLVLAIARPQWGAKPETASERLDVLLALDISTSMLATDGTPDRRLIQAKKLMFSLLDQLYGNRIGLLFFADASIVVCPLTDDISTLKNRLSAMTPETLTDRGTRIGNAINVSIDRLILKDSTILQTYPDENGQKVLILFTDGEDHEGAAVGAAKDANRKGVYIYCIGVGTTDKSSPIPLPKENGGYKRDLSGNVVLTSLDEVSLQEIVKAGNGKYYHANEGITQLIVDLSRLKKQKFRVRSDGELKDRYQLFAGLALLLLIGELLIQRLGIKW